MSRIRTALLGFSLILLTAGSFSAQAEEYYVGYTFIHPDIGDYCVIIRFRAYDGTFTLTKADAIYTLLADLIGGFSSDVPATHTIPSAAKAKGFTGEGLGSAFLANGVETCKSSDGIAVDAMGFVSVFNCEYQKQNQLCIRLYIDTGATNLSTFGIPQGPTGIGGIFIRREVWDTASALILGNPGLIPTLPLPLSAGPKLQPIFEAEANVRNEPAWDREFWPPEEGYIDP